MTQVNDGGDQRQSLRPGRHVDHERAVDFQLVHRQFGEVGERGEAGAEVVDGYRYAQSADRLHGRDTAFDVLHDHAFGDFEFQSGGRLRVDTDGLLDLGDET